MPNAQRDQNNVKITRDAAGSSLVLVCEHASSHIPKEFKDLGLVPDARQSHVAWDPGAAGVAQGMSSCLDAVLLETTVSRLVYDCNRPPSAPDAMPEKSEMHVVPGNIGLSETERARRTKLFYEPFAMGLRQCLTDKTSPVLITIHSFTPIYNGTPREVEIGVLHDSDVRLADAMLSVASECVSEKVERNAPYGPNDGVTHTLRTHAIPYGHLNVMIEVRNDLISTPKRQMEMAETLSVWLRVALQSLGLTAEGAPCTV